MLYNKDGKYILTSSYSGSDMLVSFLFPNCAPVTVGTASTVSYSTFREKKQLRTLGRVSTRGITQGPRTVGGTLIFTVIRQHITNDILEELKKSNSEMYGEYDRIKPDELPPFDIIVTFANEYGQAAKMIIYGCTIVDDNKTLSIEDVFTENTMTYIGRDVDLMKDNTNEMNSSNKIVVGESSESVSPIGRVSITKTNVLQDYLAAQKLIADIAAKYDVSGV